MSKSSSLVNSERQSVNETESEYDLYVEIFDGIGNDKSINMSKVSDSNPQFPHHIDDIYWPINISVISESSRFKK